MRTVVVTGGGTGIGRAIAAQFVSEGCNVVITGRRADVLARAVDEMGNSVRAITLDGTDAEQTAAMAQLINALRITQTYTGSTSPPHRDWQKVSQSQTMQPALPALGGTVREESSNL